jgi:hypothetical protein
VAALSGVIAATLILNWAGAASFNSSAVADQTLNAACRSCFYHRFGPVAADNMTVMMGARWIVESLHDGEDPRDIAARWQADLTAFRLLRQRYLLY